MHDAEGSLDSSIVKDKFEKYVHHLMQEKVAIRATLQGEERLQHNFSSGGFCAAALHLDLRNCTNAAASLCIETGTGTPSRGTHNVPTSSDMALFYTSPF